MVQILSISMDSNRNISRIAGRKEHQRLLSGEVKWDQLLHRNVQRFRGGLVFKAHRLCVVSLNSRLESNKEEERVKWDLAVVGVEDLVELPL